MHGRPERRNQGDTQRDVPGLWIEQTEGAISGSKCSATSEPVAATV